MKPINLEIVDLALQRVDGQHFEKFANAAFAELMGSDYIPLGGYADWGADGLLSSATGSKRPHVFYQFSIEEDFRGKIRETVERLREVGRDVKTLHYGTSRVIPRVDIEENKLSDELGINVRIRDGGYLASQVNTSVALLAAYHTYLAPAVAFLHDLNAAPAHIDTIDNTNAAVYVFLRNELENREGGGPIEGLADGLIIWALRDTDPDAGKLLSESDILKQIEKDVPGIEKVLGEYIPSRLKVLRSIPQQNQRPIRHHRKEDKYCIAFDLRRRIGEENTEAETLHQHILKTYGLRIDQYSPQSSPQDIDMLSRVAFRCITHCLEKEGIEFVAFLRGEADEPSTMGMRIDECLLDEKIPRHQFSRCRDIVRWVLREAFENPSREERLLYSRIGSVYTILFCLRTEPKLLQYFQKVVGHFRLYVGADVLVQALGERFATPEQQLFRNTLKLIRSAQGKLILTEPVLEEVQSHINASNHEFRYNYEDNEDAINEENLQFIDRPLIQAYFRGKFSTFRDRPRNWPQFLNNYCDPRNVTSASAKEQLRKLLMVDMGMEFESREEIEAACEGRPVEQLAKLLEPYKKDKSLARNDSLMAHLIYVRRSEGGERDDVSSYGMRTWWLTNEFRIVRLSRDLIHAEGAGYLMRPDYVLNFLTLLPKKADARAIFDTLFPSLLGVHLARIQSPEHVERLHQYLQEIKSVEPARRQVMIAEQNNRLMCDLRNASWSGKPNSQAVLDPE